jgi:hypothetical protein
MPFVTINPAAIEVGDPVTADLLTKIKNNEDDHETRIDSLEATNKKIEVFKYLILNGSSFSTATGLDHYRAEDSFTVTKVAIQIFEKNGVSSGSLEIDVKKSVTNLNGASFSTIMTTKPSINFATASDYDESTNQVINTLNASVTAGQYLRLDITSTPSGASGVAPKFLVTVYGE